MKKIIILSIGLLSFSLMAGGTPDFRNLTKDDLKVVSKEFHANFVPTTVSGASNLGKLWGFQLGLIANRTSTEKLKNISTDDFSEIYNAALFGRVDAIFGLGAEVTMLPVELGGLKLKTYSFGLKWTVTEVFKVLPFNLKVRAYYNTADIAYEDNDGTSQFDVSYKHKGKGIDFTISKKILLVEPYIGIGYVSGESDLEANGSTNFFGSTVSQGLDNKGIKTSGTHMFVGVNASLLIANLGLEYSRTLGANRIAAKIAFGF